MKQFEQLDRVPVPNFIRRLMLSASEEQLQEATDNFAAYVQLVMRMHRQQKKEGRSDEVRARIQRAQERERVRLFAMDTLGTFIGLLKHRAVLKERQESKTPKA